MERRDSGRENVKSAAFTLSIPTMSTVNVATLKEDGNGSSGESVLSTTSELLGGHLDIPNYLSTPQTHKRSQLYE